MRDPGNNSRLELWLVLLGMVIMISSFLNTCIAQTYYLNCYDGPDQYSRMQIHLKAIDLDQKEIISDIDLHGTGVILDKKPIMLNVANGTYLISFSENGGYNKNSEMGLPHYITYYSIIGVRNDSLNLIRNDSLIGEVVDFIRQFPNELGFRFAIKNDQDSSYILPPGLYTLNRNNRFGILRNVPRDEIPGGVANINGFPLLKRIWGADNYRLYHSFHNSQYWAVKLNEQLDNIIDSVQLRRTGGQATIYAYHPSRDKFYCIHVNYEMHGEYTDKNRQDYYIQPEVLIYDPTNLHLLEQFSINDYPEGNYPGRENGLADVMGDYIVYYFFQDDWIGIFAPAMLFIFDTRTNEATWLRVGWR